jgi:hypothetical protein
MLVKFLLYRLNPAFQVLNCLMLKDIFDNILAGQPFEPAILFFSYRILSISIIDNLYLLCRKSSVIMNPN